MRDGTQEIPRILIGTRNEKKRREIAAFLESRGFSTASVRDTVPGTTDPEETGETFLENALIKARAFSEASGLPCLADDSGLEVDVLGGRPGVHSARFAGPGARDADNNARLLAEMAGVEPARRGAGYRCVLVLCAAERVLATAEGTCRGVILTAPRGTGGFGYDPLFLMPDLQRTFAELSPEEKADRSHRGRALLALVERLPRALAGSALDSPS